mgnify:CR=1 FL=1
MRATTPWRRMVQRFQQRLLEIEVVNLEHVERAIEQGHGLLLTPNHPGHADCFLLWEALLKLGQPCHVMTAWQAFAMVRPWERLLYRLHGCFSIDREGTDLQAFRHAVGVLAKSSNPLTIFPEGDVYHLNDRVQPFRDGTARIVLSAVKRGKRPVQWVPCALRYEYVKDPTPELVQVMSELEARLHWRPRPDLPLSARIYRFAEGMLKLKEIEYVGQASNGPLPERLTRLGDFILQRLEEQYDIDHRAVGQPERVKELRRVVIARQLELSPDEAAHEQLANDLEDLFFVIQLFSYPGDYVADRASVERIAETIDKFEEDFLDLKTARVRGTRRGWITFGEPIVVSDAGGRDAAQQLTAEAEQRVQSLLDDFSTTEVRRSA